jgi:lysophospholipase L1-like esterase
MRKILYVLLFQCLAITLVAQDPLRFEKEVSNLVAGDSLVNKKKLIVFTGSSSIRMWNDLKTDFPNHNVLNRGFGGSEMSDLVYFAKPLILNYKPSAVFIYEGDNDISVGRSVEVILSNADKLVTQIRQQLLANVKIIFISAKPSVARWQLKAKYEDFNRQLKQWTATKKNVLYVDVWTPMLDEKGEVRNDLFLADNLHMNRKGYDIWKKVIAPYLK